MLVNKSCVKAPYRCRHRSFDSINWSCGDLRIEDGQLTVASEYEWLSWLEQVQVPLVFFGIWPIGVPDPSYQYGRPWTWEASLVLHALSRHRGGLGLSRSQVIDVYRDLLNSKKVPLRGLFIACAKVRLLFH